MTLRILLDSHTLVWFARGDRRLSSIARTEIERSTVYVSAATCWELATKVRLGKWPEAQELIDDFSSVMKMFAFDGLPISLEHGRLAGALESTHKDPFDRIFAAQAHIDDLTLITADPAFRTFDVRTLW